METNTPLPLLALILTYMICINLVTIGAFWIDKRRATGGEFRLPEANLLLLALVGGTPGAYFARNRFRHKTRKQPVCFQRHSIAILQTAAVAVLLFYLGRRLFQG